MKGEWNDIFKSANDLLRFPKWHASEPNDIFKPAKDFLDPLDDIS